MATEERSDKPRVEGLFPPPPLLSLTAEFPDDARPGLRRKLTVTEGFSDESGSFQASGLYDYAELTVWTIRGTVPGVSMHVTLQYNPGGDDGEWTDYSHDEHSSTFIWKPPALPARGVLIVWAGDKADRETPRLILQANPLG
jgi:hypothetical protein